MISWTGDLVGAGPIKSLSLVVSSHLGSYYHVSQKLVLAFLLLFRMKGPCYKGKKGTLHLFLEKNLVHRLLANICLFDFLKDENFLGRMV